MKFIKQFEKFQKNSEKDPALQMNKDGWWKHNYKELIEFASSLEWDDWYYVHCDEDKEEVEAIMDQTGKHKALYLLNLYEIDELEEFLEDDSLLSDEELEKKHRSLG